MTKNPKSIFHLHLPPLLGKKHNIMNFHRSHGACAHITLPTYEHHLLLTFFYTKSAFCTHFFCLVSEVVGLAWARNWSFFYAISRLRGKNLRWNEKLYFFNWFHIFLFHKLNSDIGKVCRPWWPERNSK